MKTDRLKSYRYGISAEKYAALYLRCKGYSVIAERYRNAHGEIDIVALKGKTLAAIEVKARRTFKDCEETITARKRQRVARAVEGLMGGQGKISGLARARERNIRFDVIWVAPWRLPRHIKNAWSM